MPVFNFDPATSFNSVARKVSNVFDELEKGMSFEIGGFAPRVDIREDDKQIYVTAEMPGIKKEDISLSINEEMILTIKGDKKKESSDGVKCVKSERTFGQFTRSFLLPDNVNKESINAKFEDGILNISLSKKEAEKAKEININIK